MMKTTDVREGHVYRHRGSERVVVTRIFGRGRERKVEFMGLDGQRRTKLIDFFAADVEPLTADPDEKE